MDPFPSCKAPLNLWRLTAVSYHQQMTNPIRVPPLWAGVDLTSPLQPSNSSKAQSNALHFLLVNTRIQKLNNIQILPHYHICTQSYLQTFTRTSLHNFRGLFSSLTFLFYSLFWQQLQLLFHKSWHGKVFSHQVWILNCAIHNKINS